MPVVSPAVKDFSELALERAVNEIVEAKIPFVPFVMTERDGHREFHRFATERLEQSTGAARHFLRISTVYDRALIAWDGFVTVGGKITDAVLVEISEAGAETSTIVARRYRRRLFRTPIALEGSIAVGEGHPLF